MPDSPTTLPDHVLDAMASSMLDPALEREASASGNIVRKQVLQRALNAASELGWTMQNGN